MNILIAGAGGYIGMNLIPLLKSAGHNLICVVRGRTQLKGLEEQILMLKSNL